MLIGLAGNKGSGKDTSANILLLFVPNSKSFAFADPLKEALLLFYSQWGITRKHLWGPSRLRDTEIPLISPKTGQNNTLRHSLQTLGTQWGRKLISPDIWVKITLAKAQEELRNETELVLITDVRMINEAKAIKEAGGEIWFIERKKEDNRTWWKKVFDKLFSKEHESESQLKSKEFQKFVDKRIDNNGTTEQLKENLWKSLKK